MGWWTFVSYASCIMVNPVDVVRASCPPLTGAQAAAGVFEMIIPQHDSTTRNFAAVGLSGYQRHVFSPLPISRIPPPIGFVLLLEYGTLIPLLPYDIGSMRNALGNGSGPSRQTEHPPIPKARRHERARCAGGNSTSSMHLHSFSPP